MTRIFAAVAGVLLLASCGAPREGERCNPLLFQTGDQCAAGLTCAYPSGCGVAYCCPSSGPSASPSCAACPSPEPPPDMASPADGPTSD